jgi:hypothetical protein
MIVVDVSLRAPIAVPVAIRDNARRVFRLAWNIGEDGVRLERRLPFESGRPVEAWLRLPSGEALALAARIAAGGPDDEDADAAGELTFIDPPGEARVALRRYVVERLGLPR